MEFPLVSIIIPCYNQGKFLSEALDSVLNQSYLQWECIIMDDGSCDNSKDIALEYVNRDNRFVYHYQENQGLATTRNNAILYSHGIFILPLDADDKIHRDYVRDAVEILNREHNVKIVYCDAELFGAKKGKWILPSYDILTMLRANCIFCTALFRRCDYDNTVGYNPNMKFGWEDWDFWLSLLELGGDVYKINETYFYYRVKNNSMIVELKRSQDEIDYLTEMIVKNHPLLYMHL